MFLNRIFCVSVLLLLQILALAQNQPDTARVLDEVIVVGNRYREVIPSQQLSGEKLEALSSFSVADAIRYFSGIQIKDYGGIGGLKTVDIRSLGSNHLGVFYDGIEIGNAQNGTVDLGRFSLDFIEEINLYNGQKSDIFQSAKDFGSAGTVYLRTRRPKFVDGKRTNIVSYFRTGSFDLVNPSVLWEQKISKNTALSLNAEYVYSSGKYPFHYRRVLPDKTVAWDTTAVRQNGDIHSLRLEGGLSGFLEQGKWHVKGYYYDSEKGLPGAIVNNEWMSPQRQWDRNAFVQGSFQKQLSANYDFLVNAKYSNDYMRYLSLDVIPWDSAGHIAYKTLHIDNHFRQQEIYVSTAHKYTVLPTWEIDLSVDYIWNTLDADLTNFVYPARNTMLAALATAFEWQRLKAQASVLGTFVFEDIGKRNAYKPNDKQEFTPAVFLSYKPFKSRGLNFRAFYKRIFRMPTFNDLYYTDIGNINLRPEFTVQYNLGFQYEKQFRRGIVNYVNFRADAYYNEVIDKIIATPKKGSAHSSLYRWEMMNLGYVEIRGVDVSAQVNWKLPTDIQINTSLNYTFQKAQDFSDKNSKWYGGQIAYVPWHSGSAIANAVRRSWDLNYSFIYVGKRYQNSANIRDNRELPWYTHDLTIGKSFKLKKVKLKISAEVNNLLNQYYDVVANYPMPGRNYKVILKVDI
jgi:outer membrane cobalamin receptor